MGSLNTCSPEETQFLFSLSSLISHAFNKVIFFKEPILCVIVLAGCWYRSVISSVHPKINGFDMGRHPLICRLMKGATTDVHLYQSILRPGHSYDHLNLDLAWIVLTGDKNNGFWCGDLNIVTLPTAGAYLSHYMLAMKWKVKLTMK